MDTDADATDISRTKGRITINEAATIDGRGEFLEFVDMARDVTPAAFGGTGDAIRQSNLAQLKGA